MAAVNDEVLLNIDGLSKSFGGVTAVVDFGLELRRDHVVGLIGPNGAGKTTIFNLISGITLLIEGKCSSSAGTLPTRSPTQ